ncbi:hypothetical protein GOV03_04875 [Candidatus Woesearchaeota archaeon]|nr:hypothetical protein [Candidatus Woesearchaeota archaeon]
MIKTLELLVGSEREERNSAQVSLEIVYPSGGSPSTIIIHHCDLKKRKRRQKTITYEFDVPTAELKLIRDYRGNFKDMDFRWNERLLADYSNEEIKEEKEKAYDTLTEILTQLKKDHQEAKTKKKDEYDPFIKVLKSLSASQGPPQEELPFDYNI